MMAEDTAGWKRTAATISAILLGLIFLVSGGWKVLRPFETAEVLTQAQVPEKLALLGAVSLGTLELFAAFLLFVPRFRRWGGLLGSALMIFFIVWVASYYHVLVGKECGCFPIIKRAVGPGFFFGDSVMLLLAVVAFAWSPGVARFKVPAYALVALAALAAVSFGLNAAERGNIEVPSPVDVDGKPQSLAHGKVFLFFYDPSCLHCDAASKFMSKLNWGDTQIVAIPTVNPQWAKSFLQDTGLKASTSLDKEKLRKAFTFVDPPYGVAVENGRVKKTFGQSQFNAPLPQPELKRLGFVK
jgi:uncharacterized membrane protein YphA (DoxX/SURF4 family)